MKQIYSLLALGLILAGCTTISADPIHDVISAVPAPSSGSSIQGTVTQGLLDASSNLDKAVTVEALDATDPAPACLHATLKDLGIDPASPQSTVPSFVPKVSDLISAGSVLYIRAQQAKKLAANGGLTVQIPCKALIGQLVIDAGKVLGKAALQSVPGLGMLQGILPQ